MTADELGEDEFDEEGLEDEEEDEGEICPRCAFPMEECECEDDFDEDEEDEEDEDEDEDEDRM